MFLSNNAIFETAHGLVHSTRLCRWLIVKIETATNDPIFFLHHGFVDYIWEEFSQTTQKVQARRLCRKCMQLFHEADALMKPFMIKNYNSLSHHYAIELSFYEPRPTCSEFNPTCLSPYLYCDTESNRCLSKIKPSGNYTEFEGTIFVTNLNALGRCQILPKPNLFEL